MPYSIQTDSPGGLSGLRSMPSLGVKCGSLGGMKDARKSTEAANPSSLNKRSQFMFVNPYTAACEALEAFESVKKRRPGYVANFHGADAQDAMRYHREALRDDASVQLFVNRSDVHEAALALLLVNTVRNKPTPGVAA